MGNYNRGFAASPLSNIPFHQIVQIYNQTLPEAQPTQAIDSITWVISPAKKNANSVEQKIQVKDSIGSNSGHQVAPYLQNGGPVGPAVAAKFWQNPQQQKLSWTSKRRFKSDLIVLTKNTKDWHW